MTNKFIMPSMVREVETFPVLSYEQSTPKGGIFYLLKRKYEIKHRLPGMGRETQKAAKCRKGGKGSIAGMRGLLAGQGKGIGGSPQRLQALL